MSSAANTIDFTTFIIANLINLLISAIFIVRQHGKEKAEHHMGLIVVILSIPLFIFALMNYNIGREWWTFILPLPMVLYAIVEFILDYYLKSNFRETWLLGPYLLIFYMALFGMIGYTFLVNPIFGYITLSTYFISLLATWYGHR